MRYLVISVVLVWMVGCSSKEKEENTAPIVHPTSPEPADSSKQPPELPKL